MHSWSLAAWEQGLELGPGLPGPDGLRGHFCHTINGPPNTLLSPRREACHDLKPDGRTALLFFSGTDVPLKLLLMSLFESLEFGRFNVTGFFLLHHVSTLTLGEHMAHVGY